MQNQQDNSLVPAKKYLPVLPQHRDSAIQIFQTSSDVSTPEKLAVVIADPTIARYKDLPADTRQLWLGSQIYALCLILHYQAPVAEDVKLDCAFADQMIMDDEGIQCLKQVEMQEAFRRGIAREYGEFYGITASSLVGFLKGYRKSAKRQEAISILYQKQQAEERENRKREQAAYEEIAQHCIERGIYLPGLRPGTLDKQLTKEDSEAHRQKIARQREEILKAQNNVEIL